MSEKRMERWPTSLTPEPWLASVLANMPPSRVEVVAWLHRWYEKIRDTPSAYGCDASLVVMERSNSMHFHGWFDHPSNRIGIVIDPIPATMLATLVHEVAHWAAESRHKRKHGYRWRRTCAAIAFELTGVRVGGAAERWRHENRLRWHPRPNRQDALDLTLESVFRAMRVSP